MGGVLQFVRLEHMPSFKERVYPTTQTKLEWSDVSFNMILQENNNNNDDDFSIFWAKVFFYDSHLIYFPNKYYYHSSYKISDI